VELRANYRGKHDPVMAFLKYLISMKYTKTLGVLLLLLHLYLFVETFFWQGPVMPAWRFFLGIVGAIAGITAGIYLINSRKS